MKEILLTQNQVAKVSDNRFIYYSQWRWYAQWSEDTKSFYAVRDERKNLVRRHVYMHRDIMNTPENMFCDHINHDTLDNQDENLRNVTPSQNQMNKVMARKNKLGHKNIRRHGPSFEVTIKKEGRCVFYKTFRTLEEAIIVRDEMIKKYHGNFHYL